MTNENGKVLKKNKYEVVFFKQKNPEVQPPRDLFSRTIAEMYFWHEKLFADENWFATTYNMWADLLARITEDERSDIEFADEETIKEIYGELTEEEISKKVLESGKYVIIPLYLIDDQEKSLSVVKNKSAEADFLGYILYDKGKAPKNLTNEEIYKQLDKEIQCYNLWLSGNLFGVEIFEDGVSVKEEKDFLSESLDSFIDLVIDQLNLLPSEIKEAWEKKKIKLESISDELMERIGVATKMKKEEESVVYKDYLKKARDMIAGNFEVSRKERMELYDYYEKFFKNAFNIFAPEGTKVVCVDIDDDYIRGSGGYLKLHETYTIKATYPSDSLTTVELKEFPNVHFNSKCFHEKHKFDPKEFN